MPKAGFKSITIPTDTFNRIKENGFYPQGLLKSKLDEIDNLHKIALRIKRKPLIVDMYTP